MNLPIGQVSLVATHPGGKLTRMLRASTEHVLAICESPLFAPRRSVRDHRSNFGRAAKSRLKTLCSCGEFEPFDDDCCSIRFG
jgi:hypothetical protein